MISFLPTNRFQSVLKILRTPNLPTSVASIAEMLWIPASLIVVNKAASFLK